MDMAMLCKLFFSVGIAVDLGGTLIPSFRTKIMNYGRNTTPSNPVETSASSQSYFDTLLDIVASVQVPHTWFIHYYIVSVVSSLFWGFQIFTHGRVLHFMASYTQHSSVGMTLNQVVLAWALMMFQGIRRLYECSTLTKPSQSKMWIGLWAIGISYYVFMGISVWIEGIAELTMPEQSLNFSIPSIRTISSALLFVLASWFQHDCHVYLGGLKKYTLPEQGMFKKVVCPHYTSECLIYVALAIVAAPQGQMFNRTILAGLGFVASNLAVTADSTKKWYAERFGAEKLEGRRRMVPYIF